MQATDRSLTRRERREAVRQAERDPFTWFMRGTAQYERASAYEQIIVDFVHIWSMEHAWPFGGEEELFKKDPFLIPSPPLAIDIIDHLRDVRGMPYDDAVFLIAELVRRGLLRAFPNDEPGFSDLSDYAYIEVA